MNELKSIYVAGKMQDDGWRYALFDECDAPDGHARQLGCNPLTIEFGSHWPENSTVTVCGLLYTGPFFVDTLGGHGFDGDEDEHGANIRLAACKHSADVALQQEDVQRWCLSAIKRADLFVAWIDGIDCYGTIAEIGYAKALGKPVWIAGPRYYRDLWFVYRMADNLRAGDSVLSHGMEFKKWLASEIDGYRQEKTYLRRVDKFIHEITIEVDGAYPVDLSGILPPALVKALHDPFNYALGLHNGQVIHFTEARLVKGGIWVELRGWSGSVDGDIEMTGVEHHFPRGLDVRLSDIAWVADAPDGS